MKHSAAILVVVLAAIAFIATGDGYRLYVIATVGLTAIVGVGLNVLVGLTGQISLGHVGFYAIGAYVVGILTTTFGWSFWPALLGAGVLAGLAGLLLAVPALRVRGPYLAMVTIAFGFVVEQGTAEWSGLTGGWNGLSGIPAPALFGHDFSDRGIAYLTLALATLAFAFYHRLSISRWGRAMRAVRDSEIASVSIGLNPTVIRATAFAISAALAGTAGGVFASIANFISPESFPFFQSILFLLAIMVGGVDSVFGPLIGAVIVVLLPETLSALAQYRLLFVGILMLVVLRVAPAGFIGLLRRSSTIERFPQVPQSQNDVLSFLAPAGVRRRLSARDLTLSFGGVQAVKGVSFDACPGEITSLIGPNGAGKSTVLNLICGFYQPDSGSVRLGDLEITGLATHAIARNGIARTYQTSQLFETLSVLDNVLIGLHHGRLGIPALAATDLDRDRLEIVEHLLSFVGYRGAMDRPAGTLPHVDKRLVEIARALATRPEIIALDEPAAGLDAADKTALGDVLWRVASAGIAVVLVEHDMDLVMRVSNRVVVLDAGAKIAEGAPALVAANEKVLEAYLGAGKSADRSRTKTRPAESVPALSATALAAGYGAATILRGVTLDINSGELVAVVGANGAGKTTLMRALSGLLHPTSGDVSLFDQPIVGWSADRIVARGLVLVPEGRQVFPDLTVIDNLRLGGFTRSSKDQRRLLNTLLGRFPPLRERRAQLAGSLSGGEQQMLAIARGLMGRPRVLLLDEPSLGLAPKMLDDLYELIAELRDEGTTILLVDQMAGLALSVADRAYVLKGGTIARSGSATEIAKDPELAHAYLGKHEQRI
ncbi:MAG: ATP-binding cassette domain-containing protein [Bradyrhizobiaceae bacterium]|nr:ATP-binding cassette domain-containing protein [Bradyrhizobiaceae bacterium]